MIAVRASLYCLKDQVHFQLLTDRRSLAPHFRPDGANVPRPGLASGVLETGQNRDVLPLQRKLCARRIDVRKTSIVDENQESFRFYTLLRRDCVEEHVTVNRQESKCRLYLGRAMASLLAVLEELCVSSAIQKSSRFSKDSPTNV